MPDLPTMREMIDGWRTLASKDRKVVPRLAKNLDIPTQDLLDAAMTHERCATELESLYSQLAALVEQWESCAGHNALPLNESPLTLKLCAKQLGARLGPAKETPAGEPTETKSAAPGKEQR